MDEPKIGVTELAAWLRGLGYEVIGPPDDDRRLVVTIDHLGRVNLSKPETD